MIIYDADGVHQKKLGTDILKQDLLLSSFMLATYIVFYFYQPFLFAFFKM